MRRLVGAVAAAAVGAVLVVAPAEAMPVRAFGAAVTVSTGTVDPYGLSQAVLPDGTVGVAWSETANSVHLAVRRPGASAFTELTPLTLEPGYSLNIPGLPLLWPIVTLRPAGSEFLVGWGESGPSPRVRVSRVGAGATAVPEPTTASGAVGLSNGLPVAFGTATDGSAVAAWFTPGVGGYQVQVARRPGTSGAWQQLGSAGTATFPYDLVATIDTSRSATVGWVYPAAPGMTTRVRSHQGGSWGLTVVPGPQSSDLTSVVRYLSASSSGTATVVALTESVAGSTLYEGASGARGVRLLERPSSSAGWTLSGALVGPGRFAATPEVMMAPDGSAVVAFTDIASGSSAAVNTLTTVTAQRRGATGTWGAARGVYSIAASSGLDQILGGRLTPGLAPDGTLVIPVPAPVLAGGGDVELGVATVWRPGWDAPFTSQTTLVGTALQTFPLSVSAVVDAAGRATAALAKAPPNTINVATTALPPPLARSRASLSSSTPSVGSAVTCVSAWTGAKTLAFRWLRAGATISGATAKTYTPKAGDRGMALACRVTATNPTGSTVSTSVGRVVS